MHTYIRPLPVVEAPEIQFPQTVKDAERWDYLCFAIQKSAEEKRNGKEKNSDYTS